MSLVRAPEVLDRRGQGLAYRTKFSFCCISSSDKGRWLAKVLRQVACWDLLRANHLQGTKPWILMIVL